MQNQIWKWKKCVVALIVAVCLLSSGTTTYALESETDTIWGSVPASVYITREFYKDENTIEVPIQYIEEMEGDGTLEEKAKSAFWEAQRQSCYLFGDLSVSISVNNDAVALTRNSYFDLETERKMRETVEAEAERVLSRIVSDNMTDYEKAKAIYNYVCEAVYDWDAYNAITGEDCHGQASVWAKSVGSYGNLIDRKSVCQGDAQAFSLLARKAGLTTMMATGKMSNGGGHAWNRVWCNSRWYEVDCCFEAFCATYASYTAQTGVTYGGVGIIPGSMEEFYGA